MNHENPSQPFTEATGYVPDESRQKGRLTHGVSWPDARVLHFAKSAAHSQNMTLSAYINNLVRREAGMTHALIRSTEFIAPNGSRWASAEEAFHFFYEENRINSDALNSVVKERNAIKAHNKGVTPPNA